MNSTQEKNPVCINKTPITVCTLQSHKKYSVPCEKRKIKTFAWQVLKEDWEKNESLFNVNRLTGWKEFMQVKNIWKLEDKPYCNIFKTLPCLKPNFLEYAGILSDRMIAENSSCLAKCPDYNQFVVTKAELYNLRLNDISIFRHHIYLQYIDLSHNNLENISALGYVSYLIYLDVSYNKLTKLLNFKPPLKLTYVNYSNNELKEISDISEFWTITHLNLSHNNISEIKNLENLKFLEVLDLSYNKIEILINFYANPLRYLSLENNLIWTYNTDTDEKTNHLVKLNLSHNYINSLNLLVIFSSIIDLNLSFNNIENILDLEYFKLLNRMEFLSLIGNPIVQWAQYRLFFIFQLKSLKELDGKRVSSIEKIRAKQFYNIKGERFENFLLFARKTILSKRRLTLEGGLFPIDKHPPPLIAIIGPIFGPIADFFEYIADHKKYKHLFYFLKCHATESKLFSLFNYIVISCDEFTNYIRENKFKAIGYRYGYRIGLSNDELNKWIYSGKIGLFNAPISLIHNLRLVGIESIIICAYPEDKIFHEIMNRSKIYISTFSFQEGAYFYKKRSVNIKPSKFSVSDIIKELIIKVIPSKECEMEAVVEDTKRICSKEFHEDFGSLKEDYKIMYDSNLKSNLEGKIPTNSKNVFSKFNYNTNISLSNIYSSKMMKESCSFLVPFNSVILPKKSEVKNLSSVSNVLENPSTLSKTKKNVSQKSIQIDSLSNKNIYEEEIELSDSPIIEEQCIQSFRELLPEKMIARRKKMIQIVTQVFHAHQLSLASIYHEAHLRQAGLFSKFLYINQENYRDIILKGIKESLKENYYSLSHFDRIKGTMLYKEAYNSNINLIATFLDNNSTISKKQELEKKNFKIPYCKFF